VYHTIRLTSRKIKRRLSLIEPLVYRRRQTLPPFRYRRLPGPEAAPPLSPAVDDADWPTIPWLSYWSEPQTDFVLRSILHIPPGWDHSAPTALYLPIGQAGDFSHPEALVYVDGEPYAACDRHHQEILLPQRWLDGSEYLLTLHGWTGGTQDLRFDGTMPSTAARPPTRLVMGQCALVQIDQPTRDFVALARVALGVADHLDGNEPARAHLYSALDEAFRVLDTRDPLGDLFYASVPAAHDVLQSGIGRSGPPLDVHITAAGNAHIDVAWLWTLEQTRRKCERTFRTVIRLLEQFPEFRFSQSQPQLYDYVRQDSPELFERIKQRVSDGRWEPLGGMWVEADCNIPGGESLVRQFLLGRAFYREHFGDGADAPVLWLPDVFGYAWNLPQLIKAAGLEYFFTIKLGWNQTNRLPYDSFWWQGLDGTRVLTHFSPTSPPGSVHSGTFNSDASPGETLNTWVNFQQKDWGEPGVAPPLLMAFGHGDGGGGPTREMLENIRTMGSFPATPRLRCGTVAEFFRQLEAQVGDRLPTWNGELYLEFHRGTFTTHSRNKRANRRSEFLLHDAEFLAAMAATMVAAQLAPDYCYPHGELRRAWELTCLNQFHDIIPGSSITPVYVESLQQYEEVREIGERVRGEALAALAPVVGGDLLLVNPTSFARSDLAFLPRYGGYDCGDDQPSLHMAFGHADGSPVATQSVEGGWLLAGGELPPYSVTPLFFTKSSSAHRPATSSLQASPTLLENDYLRVELNDDGDITRISDKVHGREVLCDGGLANQLQAFEDRSLSPDAWDIDIFYDDKMWLAEPAESVRVVERGPLRATLEVRRRILNSDVVQRISLAHNSPRLDVDTTIQWRERHILLKVAFPVDVLSPQATYEIQWGNVQRPTHRNTSWDWARFETCAQKWVDLSEGDYGVSLLNDCKYGHDIRDQVMRISLLRGTIDPDPEADKGEHRFAYSLLPHGGGCDEQTIAQAYALNDPLLVWRGDEGPGTGGNGRSTMGEPSGAGPSSFVTVDCPNVVIETIKQAEDGRGLIVRVYESQRQRGECTLRAGFPLGEAWRSNILEEDQERLPVEGDIVRFLTKPFQIVTLRLLPV